MKPIKKLILPLLLLFLLFGGSSLIFDLIYEYPVKYIFDKIVWNDPVSALFVIIAFLLLWVQIRWIKIGYKASYNQWLAFSFIMTLFVFARFGESWSFLINHTEIPLVAWKWQSFFEDSKVLGKWYSFIFDIKLIDILFLCVAYPIGCIYKWLKSFTKKINQTPSVFKIRAVLLIFKIGLMQIPKGFSHVGSSIIRLFANKTIRVRKRLILSYKLNLRSLQKSKEIKELHFFEEDNTFTGKEFKYDKLSSFLVQNLAKQKFENSFSVGVIGPWGNGKSTFIKNLRDKLEIQLSSEQYEIIEFLPAYSHNPEQITTDFFTLLASKLKKYHGKLNQSMLTYAAKLLEVRFNGTKDIQGLLKPSNWFSENKSAIQAYQELKKIFTQIDIKTIVIIDDVDRLGKEEILQVLKIIRNTANFPNTIFLVAYDKDYVIKTIEQDLLFLDKYFQYEMFVPPHRSEELLQVFSELVLDKETGIESSRLEKVINLEILNKTLLDKFVFNYRDVKVLTNIYCTNLSLLTEDVDFIDLLHFTLLNKHFPKQVRYIYNNFGEIFDSKKDHQMGTGIVKTLKLKVFDSLETPFTVDTLITALEIKDSSQRNLFKRLFLLLFGIKDDTPIEEMHSGASKEEKLSEIHKKLQNIPYSPEIEFSIKNIERTHIYFELFLRDDDLSNVEFALKIGTDKFIYFIKDLLKDKVYRKTRILREKVKNKLEYYDEKLNTKIKIENAINTAPLVGADLTITLFYQVNNYEHLPKDLFKDESDFSEFFKEKLWENKDLTADYIIRTILRLIPLVKEIERSPDRNIVVPPYIGLTEEKVKDLLISKTKELIKDCTKVDLKFLKQLSKILDCDLNPTDSDIEFSDYLYTNQDRLFEYLKIVEKFYREEFKFRSAIFNVFTDKDLFKENCFELKEHQILIREFHHLLELYDWRKHKADGFIPFYFNSKKESFKSDDLLQAVYVKCKEEGFMCLASKEIGLVDIAPLKIKDSIYLLEGKVSYLDLIEALPNFTQPPITDYLKANKDNFEILSIQTDEDIDKSIIPYSKYNKMIAELKEETMSSEPVS